MSENITHTAIADDCLRLMGGSGDAFCPAFQDVAAARRDSARLGSVTRSGDEFTASLLAAFRSRWEGRTPEERLEEKLAFVLGWLCHRAADRQMKPVFREAEPGRPISPAHCSIYHDAFVFREIFGMGHEGPYHPAMFEDRLQSLAATAALDVAAVEELFQVLMQRALLELHTLRPDKNDIEGWMGRLFDLRQRFSVDRNRYAEAITSPNPDWVRKFIHEMNFYDRDEPIIRTARALQRGGAPDPASVRGACAVDARSHYAQALKTGYGYLSAANEFFVSDMTPEALTDRLDIGRPGRDGKSV